MCDAIAYAHSRGVLHRDLKPGNIMLGKYGETLVVDWGLAKALEQSEPEGSTERPELPLKPTSGSALEPTLAGAAIGTPAYMSPEQAEGRMDLLGPRSDVYCLGATLYHLLTGHAPCEAEQVADALQKSFQATFLVRVRSTRDCALALEAICLKAMAVEAWRPLRVRRGAQVRPGALAGRRAGGGAARVVEPASRAVDAAASGLGQAGAAALVLVTLVSVVAAAAVYPGPGAGREADGQRGGPRTEAARRPSAARPIDLTGA